MLDDDGSGLGHNDLYHADVTSYEAKYGFELNADVDPYIATPLSAQSLGVRLGDLGFVIANGQWTTSFVADYGSKGWVEVSLSLASRLGVPTVDAPWPTGPVIPQSFGPVPATVIIIPSRGR